MRICALQTIPQHRQSARLLLLRGALMSPRAHELGSTTESLAVCHTATKTVAQIMVHTPKTPIPRRVRQQHIHKTKRKHEPESTEHPRLPNWSWGAFTGPLDHIGPYLVRIGSNDPLDNIQCLSLASALTLFCISMRRLGEGADV